MSIRSKLAQLKAYREGVKHCTFDPEGPGVVRIHLVPPKFSLFKNNSSVLILNGYYILPLGYSWSVLLSAFLDNVNAYCGKELSAEDVEGIYEATVVDASKVFPADKDILRDDLSRILDVIFDISEGKDREEIEQLSIRAYASRMSAPHRMDLSVSSMANVDGSWRCNQKCVFCYAANQALACKEELTTQQWKDILDKLRQIGVPMVTFTGGEPTQRPDLCELVDHAKWFITRVNTNGSLLTEELVQGLKKASLDSIQVTLYSHDAEIHNKLVGVQKHCDTVNGIALAVKAGLDVSVNTPLCALNRDYLKTLELIKGLGVRYATVSGLILTGNADRAATGNELCESELRKIISQAHEFCKNNGMELDFTSPGLVSGEFLSSLGMRAPICGAALSNMAIGSDGTVVPCQSWLSSDADLGNILTTPWKKIWNSALSKKLRNMKEDTAMNCPFRCGKGARI